MQNLDKLKAKIQSGEPVYGVFVTLSDPCVSEIAGYAGYDFIWLDAEHSPLNLKDILAHVVAAQSTGASIFVRVPGVNPTTAKAILDMGPDGIIFPFVDSAQVAELAVKSCLYPPYGIRGQGPIRAIRYGLDDEGEYIKNSKDKTWKILQIENLKGYDNLDEILEVEGMDSLFIGSADLGRSIDLPPEEKTALLKKIIPDIINRCHQKGLPCGVASGYAPSDIQDKWNSGADWFVFSQDVRILSGAYKANLEAIKKSVVVAKD